LCIIIQDCLCYLAVFLQNAAGVLCKRWLHAQARPSRVLLAIGSSVIDGSIQVQLAVSSVA
jgi:hypothetical protein